MSHCRSNPDYTVHSVDYYPTLLEFAGNQWLPDKSQHPLDGHSFADILLNPEAKRQREPIYYLFPGYLDKRAQPCVVAIERINQDLYKLLYDWETDQWYLYQLDEDISEQSNVIKSRPEISSGLSKKIHSWLSQQHPTWTPKLPIDRSSGKPASLPTVL